MISCKEAALRSISRKMYHSHELARKLKEKGYPKEEILLALRELIALGYLNDEEYGRIFIKNAISKGWSPLQMKAKLAQKGISLSLDDAFEKEALSSFIKKKRDISKEKLYRKGFSISIINDLLGIN